MQLDEKTCKSELDAFAYKHWQPLLALIPEIENSSGFVEEFGGVKNEEDTIQSPYSIPTPIVSRFLEVVYAIPVIINFNWIDWDAGRRIASDAGFDFDTIDLVTKCKLLTAIVRNDRFCSGALVSSFESGLILKILKSIEKQVK